MNAGEDIVFAEIAKPVHEVMDILFPGQVHRHIFQQILHVRRIRFLIIIYAQVAGQVMVMIHGRFQEGVDMLLFQAVIGNGIRLADCFNVWNHHAAVCPQVPVPYTHIFFVVQVLELSHFRSDPFPAPLKGIGNPIALFFKYIHPVTGKELPYFPKHPVHRCFIVRSRHEHAGEAENLVLCGLVHRLVLRFPAAAQQHEDTAAPPGPRRYDVAYSLSKLRYVFFSVKGMLFIGCFIGLLAPAVVFLVQKGSQMAAQLLIFLKTQGFAIGIVMVAADDL